MCVRRMPRPVASWSAWKLLESGEDVVDLGAAGVVGVDVDELQDGVAVDDQDGPHRQNGSAALGLAVAPWPFPDRPRAHRHRRRDNRGIRDVCDQRQPDAGYCARGPSVSVPRA